MRTRRESQTNKQWKQTRDHELISRWWNEAAQQKKGRTICCSGDRCRALPLADIHGEDIHAEAGHAEIKQAEHVGRSGGFFAALGGQGACSGYGARARARVGVRARACACARARVWVRERAWVRVGARGCIYIGGRRTMRVTLLRKAGGVFCTMSAPWMKPACVTCTARAE
eukprot:6185539-Pleurochrysis_carterae.AAC.1